MKRPGRYVPLSVYFACGRTGTAILERYGFEGLGVWTAMLAAAKQHNPEGHLTFRHEQDWQAIGVDTPTPSFELVEFLTFLGQRKQTRKTRHGRMMYVELTRWEEWNKAWRTQEASGRMSRKRATSERTPTVTASEPKENLEVEVEVEVENPSLRTRKKDALWDVFAAVLPVPATSSERGRWNKGLKDIRDVGASPAELERAISVYRKRMPDMPVTPTAIASHWGELFNGALPHELTPAQKGELAMAETRRRAAAAAERTRQRESA